MRMWMCDTRILCKNHLLGEHNELHKMMGTLKKGISVDGYITNGLLEFHSMKSRHEELVKEMKLRGYNHMSPFKNFKLGKSYGDSLYQSKVDKEKALKDLLGRCSECRRRYVIIKKGD